MPHNATIWNKMLVTWWRHQMETFSALLAHCEGNSQVTGEFFSQRPVTRSFDAFFICTWTNGWVNNRDAGDLRRYRAHYDVTVIRRICNAENNSMTWRCNLTTPLPMLFWTPCHKCMGLYVCSEWWDLMKRSCPINAGIEFKTFRLRQHRQLPVLQHVCSIYARRRFWWQDQLRWHCRIDRIVSMMVKRQMEWLITCTTLPQGSPHCLFGGRLFPGITSQS